jgi:hypothetical protein
MRSQLGMRNLRGAALIGAFGLVAIGLSGSAAEDGKHILPDADYPKMVKYAVKGLQDALKGTPDEARVNKARTAAVMIAAYAQQNLDGADGQQRATVRDAALKLVDTIQNKKYAEAIKQADAIPSLAADPKAKKEKITLIGNQIQVADLMQQFKFPPEGGWGIDRKLYGYRLGMKSKIPESDLNEKLAFEAYQVAVTTDLLLERKNVGDKTKEWQTFAGDLQKAALQLAEAARAKDGGSGQDAVVKMTTSCTGCHKAFRANK